MSDTRQANYRIVMIYGKRITVHDPGSRPRAKLKAAAAVGLLALLGGCGVQRMAATAAPNPASRHPASDAVSAFAAQASRNEEARVALPDGQAATLRMVRRYLAASGRECAEITVSTATEQRSQLLCQGDQGAWLAARPLLRGG